MGRRVVEEPWVVVVADIIGPLPRSKAQHQYILVIQDLFTKWIEYVPLRAANGKKISELFRKLVINRWGFPRVILTDNGMEFVNSVIRSLAKEFNIVHSTTPRTTLRLTQSKGLIEY